MREPPGDISGRRYYDFASDAGYHYTDASFAFEEPLFEGFMGVQSLSCGIELCSSDLTGLCDSEHEGILDRSFTIAINLDDEQIDTAFGETGRFVLPGRSAQVVAVADAVRMANRIEKGTRSKSLLMRINPESFLDDDIAEEIHGALKGTKLVDMGLCARSFTLAHALANSRATSAVGRLLNESAALELLARALMTQDAGSHLTTYSVKSGDYARLARVRDLIEAHPFVEYSLSQLAGQAGMSLSSFKSKFPQAFGQTVFAFISDIRLDRARYLLQHEGWPVSKVAYHVGYSHQSSFAQAFKRRFGISPSEV